MASFAARDDEVEAAALALPRSVGLMTYSPSTRPTRTLPSVFWNGISENASAADAPVTASTSVSLSLSAESTSAMICVSKRQPAGKSGRQGRSIRRLVSTSFSAGLPSRLKNPPGNAARRVGVLAVVHRERQEIDALAGVGGVAGGDEHHRVAVADDGRAVGLLGQLARLDGQGLLAQSQFTFVHVTPLSGSAGNSAGVRRGGAAREGAPHGAPPECAGVQPAGRAGYLRMPRRLIRSE